jgi:hypothetical protein
MADDLSDMLASSMREKRAAQRNEITRVLQQHLLDIKSLEDEKKLLEDACDDLILKYVIDRMSKGDENGVLVFRNTAPEKVREKIDRAKEIFELVYGITPRY